MAEGLHVTLTADSSNFVAELDEAQKKAATVSRSINSSLGFVSKSYKDVAGQSQVLNATSKSVTSSFRTMKGASTQLGFQLQDIAVQAQSGTSAFVILGQQGSQIASLFGPGGALLGAVIAVASAIGGTLVAALGDGSESLDDFGDKVDAIVGNLDEIAQRELFSDIKRQEQEVQRLKRAYDDAANAPETQISILEKVLNSEEEIRAFREKSNREHVANSTAAFQALRDGELKLQALIEKRAEILDRINDKNKPEDEEDDKKEDPLTGPEAVKIAQQRLAQRFAILRQFQSMELAAQHEALGIQQEQLRAALENGLLTEQEFQQLRLEANAAFIEAREAQDEAEANRRIAREQRVNDAITASRRGAMSAAAGLLTQLGRKNKAAAIAAIAVQKGLMITQTLNSTLAAQMRALAELGPIAGPPAARAIGIWGKANAALIAASGLFQAASLGGGGGGGAGAAVENAAAGGGNGGAAGQNTIVNLNLEGETFGRASIERIIGGINEAVADGFEIRVS